MITANFTVFPYEGHVYSTNFTFTNLTTSTSNIVNQIWDFGDGNFLYNQSSPVYVYNYPGTYNVSLTATNTENEISVFSKTIYVNYLYRDSITVSQIPEDYSYPGKITSYPFKLKLISSQIKPSLILDLFVANSKSIPHNAVPEKWNFLVPTWKFLDKNFNFVSSLSVETTPLLYNNQIVAVSGEAEFYFVDNQSTGDPQKNCPLVITATLQTSSYSYPIDSQVYSYSSYANTISPSIGLVWQVNDLLPDTIKITENYLTNIYSKKWKDVKIPFLLTYHNSKNTPVAAANSYGESEILFSYPENNTLGKLSSVSIKLSNTNNFSLEETPLYFQAFNNQGTPTGGYIFTTITPTSAINTTTIQASTVCYTGITAQSNQFIYPQGYAPNTFIWITDTTNKNLNRVLLETYPNNCPTINYYKNNGNLIDGYLKVIDNLPKFSNTVLGYSLAVDPSHKEVITTNSNQNILYKLSSNGNILSALPLSSINTAFSGVSAANVCLDRDLNIYLTFFNTTSVLKLDKNFNFSNIISYTSTYNYKPPVVETDRENNVWVAYSSQSTTSSLLKYSSTNTQLSNITLSSQSVPVSLAVTRENNIWVANSFNQFLTGGTLQLYSTTTGTLMSSITSFTHPTSLTIDRSNGLWFTHGTRNLGYITTQGIMSSWYIDVSSTPGIPIFTPISIPTTPANKQSATYTQKEIGGVAIDVYNRVWIIDSITCKAYSLSATTAITNSAVRVINIVPNSNTINSTPITDEYFKPFQANGDWTGNRWYQKYYNPVNLSAISLSGTSTPFSVLSFKNPYEIYRVNEDFNNAAYYKSLALPESLNQNTNLFDGFFAAAVGTSTPSAYQDIGQTVYERIANFSYNHSDVDTCNTKQLISLANKTGTFANVFNLYFPAEIQKYLDISSISKEKLWGIKSPIALSGASIGNKLNTNTSYITAGTNIYLQSKFDSTYTLYTVPLLSTQTVYPLSSLVGLGFVQPVLANYNFYAFNPVYSNTFIENLIDWSNPYTTLTPYTSTIQEWYGDGGIVETIFTYLLTKNLTVK